MRLRVTILSLSMSALTASALSVDELEFRQRPVAALERSFYRFSPASMQWLDSITISTVYAGYRSLSLSMPVADQYGSGLDGFSLDAKSYYRFSPMTALWGSASFTSITHRDVKWSNAIDYQLLAPYVLGDSVGGDMTGQKYTFSGGFSYRLHDWAFGAEASYRAELAYRSRDPRVHDIVSDLAVRVSAARLLASRYLLSFGAGFRSYHQTSDVEFVNPVNDIQTYPLTGLGTFYNRFAGNANRGANHTLSTFTVSAQLLSRSPKGPMIYASYSRSPVSFRLRNYNNLTLATTSTDCFDFKAAWGFGLSERWLIMPAADARLSRRSGVEMLFGSALGSGYEKIGERPNYSSEERMVDCRIPVQYALSSGHLTLTPRLNYFYSRQTLCEPRRSLTHSITVSAVTADWSMVKNSWLFNVSADAIFASRCSGGSIAFDAAHQLAGGTLGLRFSYTRLSLHSYHYLNTSVYYSF